MTYFLPFWAISGQFENGKKPKNSAPIILTIFQLNKYKILDFLEKKGEKLSSVGRGESYWSS